MQPQSATVASTVVVFVLVVLLLQAWLVVGAQLRRGGAGP